MAKADPATGASGAKAVLLATYGSPANLDDVGRYLAHIIRREPTPAEIAGLRKQYEIAGGPHVLPQMTQRQAELLRSDLARHGDFEVHLGYKHSAPFLGDVAASLAARRVPTVVVPLAPHFNTMSVEGYHKAAREGATREGIANLPNAPRFAYVRSYATHPLLVEAWAERVQRGWKTAEAGTNDATRISLVFTAHSLPSRVLEAKDPYPNELASSYTAIAKAAGIAAYETAYQSAPEPKRGGPGESRSDSTRAPEGAPWLGPDIRDALQSLAARGTRSVVVAPVGFVSDHMETRFDLDHEARETAQELGLEFVRVPALNDDPKFIQCLSEVARTHLNAV